MAAVPGPKKRFGFTLIELLVVIAIIAILAAILFPVFAAARESARKATCQSNLKQFSIAFAMYKSDFDNKFPMGGWRGSPNGTPPEAGKSRDWHIALYPYVKNKGVYFCPSSTDAHTNPQDWNRTSTDYLFNNQLGRDGDGLTESGVNAPADCVNLIEGHSDWGRDGISCVTPFSNGQLVANDLWCTEYTTFGNNSSLITGGLWATDKKLWDLPRHQGGANVLFCDGHVKFLKNLAAVGAQDSVNKIQAQIPWVQTMDPKQAGGSWGAQF